VPIERDHTEICRYSKSEMAGPYSAVSWPIVELLENVFRNSFTEEFLKSLHFPEYQER